jgi:hypothetical protein
VIISIHVIYFEGMSFLLQITLIVFLFFSSFAFRLLKWTSTVPRRGVWWATVSRCRRSQKWLSNISHEHCRWVKGIVVIWCYGVLRCVFMRCVTSCCDQPEDLHSHGSYGVSIHHSGVYAPKRNTTLTSSTSTFH